MVMAGVGCDVEAWESKLLDETQSLLQQYDDVFVGSYAEHEAEKIIAGDTKSFDARMKYAEKTKRKIAENMIQLKGVFARERSRLNKATVSSMLDNLAKAYEAYVEGYKNGEVSESEILAILQERGYFKYQADEKVAQWDSEREFKSEFGDSYSDIVESYKEGLTSRDTMMAALRFKGYGDSAAEEQIAEFDIESRFDIDYSELDDAYRAGDISRENFRQAMIDNGTTPKKADQAIETYDWMRDHAEYGLEYSDAWKYAHPIDNYGYSLSDVGLDPNTYLEYKDLKKNCRGVDEDNDGKADSGTKRSAIFEMINALPIRDDQKDALACIDYTLKSVKRYAPWH